MSVCSEKTIQYPDIFKKSITHFNSNSAAYKQLSPESEYALIEQYRNEPEKLKRALVDHNVFLCVKYSRRYINNPEFENIFQNAFVGLCKSAETFDPDRGIKFSTYAFYGIKHHILSEFTNRHNKFIKRHSVTLDTGMDNVVASGAVGGPQLELAPELGGSYTTDSGSVIEGLEKSEKMKVLEEMVEYIKHTDKLTDIDKCVFANCCISGKFYTRYAKESGIDIKDVRKSMKTIRRFVKKDANIKKMIKGVL